MNESQQGTRGQKKCTIGPSRVAYLHSSIHLLVLLVGFDSIRASIQLSLYTAILILEILYSHRAMYWEY
jgi:hypothetical protein